MEQWPSCTAGGIVVGKDENANCTEEDKKFASHAVAYLIKHSREGFVPLCASIATFLQERHRLKQEVKALREHVYYLKNYSTLNSCSIEQASPLGKQDSLENLGKTSECNSQKDEACRKTVVKKNGYEYNKNSLEEGKNVLPILSLTECLCRQCLIAQKLDQAFPFPPLKSHDQVIIRGEILGEVKYVGHLDTKFLSPAIFVGMQLSEAVGNTDGSIFGKRYFFCPENFGMFVPLEDVCCAVK